MLGSLLWPESTKLIPATSAERQSIPGAGEAEPEMFVADALKGVASELTEDEEVSTGASCGGCGCRNRRGANTPTPKPISRSTAVLHAGLGVSQVGETMAASERRSHPRSSPRSRTSCRPERQLASKAASGSACSMAKREISCFSRSRTAEQAEH